MWLFIVLLAVVFLAVGALKSQSRYGESDVYRYDRRNDDLN